MSIRRRQAFCLIALLVGSALGGGCAAPSRPSLAIIPLPAEMDIGRGGFDLDDGTHITLSDPADAELRRLANFWAQPVRAATGFDLPIAGEAGDATSNIISLQLSDAAAEHPEGYRLTVTSGSVTLGAKTPAGLFYGLQTLTQLLPVGDTNVWSMPAVQIADTPRFAYRGMHLDVGRHFFPVAFIKKYIDLLAMYKMNTFHWHLTEDQGWRIEITKYPRLTEVGAYRAETVLEKNFDPYVGDGQPHGGFYTQDEVREVVAYARDRYIDVSTPGYGAIFTRPTTPGDPEGILPGTLSRALIHWDHPRAADILVSADWTRDTNEHGLAGTTSQGGVAGHGSASPFDVHATLIAVGPDFRQGLVTDLPTANVDLAPTLLHLLGLGAPRTMQGRALVEALRDGPSLTSGRVESSVYTSELPSGAAPYAVSAHVPTVDGHRYLDYAEVRRSGR